MLNGINLYAYCGNNPIVNVDENGNAWWHWLLFGIGMALLVTSAVVLAVASGGTLTGLAGAIIVGAAKGVVVGTMIGTTLGGVIGGITSGWSAEGILSGMAIGFGIGAVVGAIVGGIYSGITYGQFISNQSLLSHFGKHGSEFEGLYKDAKMYAKGAKYVMRNGKYIEELNGYIKFFGANGGANYAFVGLKQSTYKIVTFGIRSVKELAKYITWLGI